MPPIKLSTPQKVALRLVGSVVVIAGLVRFFYYPVLARMMQQRAKIQELRIKTAEARTLAAQRPAQEAEFQRVQERYRALEQHIGTGQSIARILEALSDDAKRHRLALTAVQPRMESRGPRLLRLGPETVLREVPLSLQLTGRYRQIAEFLGGLNEAPFVGVVRTVTMTKAQSEGLSLKADVELAVYLEERPSG